MSHDLSSVESGFHAVVMTFEGELTAIRFGDVEFHDDHPWKGAGAASRSQSQEVLAHEAVAEWASSLDHEEYESAVSRIREHIAEGTVYQVNACRVLSTDAQDMDMDSFFRGVLEHNPAPYACRIDVAGHLDIVSASPELFLRKQGRWLESAPIKGTAPTAETMLEKDVSENIMITDLVRNDLQQVCEAGSVVVDPLLETQYHPGLVHLVSTVQGLMQEGVRWADVFEACFPPGSVSGAPKSSALRIIDELEPVARGPYCGAIGWIDADSGRAEMSVGIRTFWRDMKRNDLAPAPIVSEKLSFGTGAGITWHSDPSGEWHETELKARRLIALSQRYGSREMS